MSIELLNMDCMDYMRGLPDKAFDLAIVDPPYGIRVGDNKAGMGRRKGSARAAYKMGDWDHEPPPHEYFSELMRVSQHQIIWGANHFIDRVGRPSPCWIVWDKLFSHDVSFAACELAWTSFSSVAKKFAGAPNQASRIHPTQKPVRLYQWLLSNYAKPGQRILDTHLGSASSAIAAHYAGFNFVGTELDPDYYADAKARFERETAQADMFAGGAA